MNGILIEYDKDYGCLKRTGWSMAIDGSYVSELEKYLIVSIIKGIITWIRWIKYDKM
jgi:hypothetical protein